VQFVCDHATNHEACETKATSALFCQLLQRSKPEMVKMAHCHSGQNPASLLQKGDLPAPQGSLADMKKRIVASAENRRGFFALLRQRVDAFDPPKPDLKLPNLMSPEKASYYNYRDRMRENAEGKVEGPALDRYGRPTVPVGSDPVEGDPVSEEDLRNRFEAAPRMSAADEEGFRPATPAEVEQANEEFKKMVGDTDEPEGFCEGMGKFNQNSPR